MRKSYNSYREINPCFRADLPKLTKPKSAVRKFFKNVFIIAENLFPYFQNFKKIIYS